MRAMASYCLILVVYIALLSCQLIICHLTHSLIILTDSYINLYKILDVSLGILHLQTQCKLGKRRRDGQNAGKSGPKFDIKLFDRTCSYQFKRLPLLGSFVNGLFLAALLMSAAIEGIQTCFHVSHAQSEGSSIITTHSSTYPIILVGFAIAGVLMQWCSSKTHRMREEELESESLLDISSPKHQSYKSSRHLEQLDVINLGSLNNVAPNNATPSVIESSSSSSSALPAMANQNVRRNTICSEGRALSFLLSDSHHLCRRNFNLNSPVRHRSSDSVPTSTDDKPRISLKSLRIAPELDSPTLVSVGTINKQSVPISRDVECNGAPRIKKTERIDKWLIIRYCTSPVALALCALIVYFIDNELATEIADAFLAVVVVVILFAASYPPMKRAGKVLLQSVPDEVELEKLKANLMSISPLILDIKEFHVWSLTPHSNRVATCKIVLDQQVKSERQIAPLLVEAKYKFLDQNIKCSTIQPIFTANEDDASQSTS